MCVGLRNDSNIKNDHRISKSNYDSRNHYSIKSVLLEKRLLSNTSKHANELMMHLLSNLEACCNRQISHL